MAQIPHGPENLFCPFIQPETVTEGGMFGTREVTRRKPMSETCHTCPMWQQFRGTNKNSGEAVDEWRCAVSTLPMLMIETASQVRQAGAATESFRNEVVRRADMAAENQQRIAYQNNALLIEGE